MLLLPDALRKVLLPFAGLLTKIALWQRSATPPKRAKSSLERYAINERKHSACLVLRTGRSTAVGMRHFC